MELQLTNYLIRTLVCKPNGLRLKLKVVGVNDWVETFHEAEYPAATIVPHGLFLARPTPQGIKDPLLVGVINHRHLQDEEPHIQYEAYSTLQPLQAVHDQHNEHPNTQPECLLAKPSEGTNAALSIRMGNTAHKISRISKSGIEKAFSCNMECEFEFSAHVQRRSNNFCYRSVDGNPSHRKFVNFIQTMLDAYKSSVLTQIDPATTQDNQDHLQIPQSQQFLLSSDFGSGFDFVGRILFDLSSSVMYIRMFLPPRESSEDRARYEVLAESANRNLQRLADAILNLLFVPLWDALVGSISQNPNNLTPDWHDIYRSFRKAKNWVETLLELSEVPTYRILGHSQILHLEYDARRFGEHLSRTLLYILGIPTAASQFFVAVADKLKEYLVLPVILDRTQVYLSLCRQLEIVDNLMLKFPEICVLRSTRGNNGSRFYPGISTATTWNISAVFMIQDVVKIAVLNMIKYIPKETRSETTSYVQVFRNESLCVSFLLPTNSFLSTEPVPICMQHFTGRYFVKFQTLGYYGPKELVVIDFAPCACRIPKPPICVKQDLKNIIGHKSSTNYILSCTDQFVALMVTEEILKVKAGHKLHKPVHLQLLKFESVLGFEILAPVRCADLFDSLTHGSTRDIIFQNTYNNSQMCWWKDLRTFYYTNWVLLDTEEDSTAVFIACIQLSTGYESMKTLAFEGISLKPLLMEYYSSDRRPAFRVLHTRVKEYLVLDITSPLDFSTGLAKPSSRILARLMFAIHRNKLQRVAVNRNFVSRFPQHIGYQMKYAGYETSYMSLFHQRRVFCSKKVVCCVHRLDYKAC